MFKTTQKTFFKKSKAIFFLQKTFIFFQPRVKIAIQNISENPENKDFQDIIFRILPEFSGFCRIFQDLQDFSRFSELWHA